MLGQQEPRTRLWRTAAAIQHRTCGAGAYPFRYQTAFSDGEGWSWTLEELLNAPDWLAWPPSKLAHFVKLVGAVGVARRWRSTIDGRVLRPAAEALGADVLDLILAIPLVDTPCLPSHPAECGDGMELMQLGGSLLLAALADQPHWAMHLQGSLPRAPGPPPDCANALIAVSAALALMDKNEPLQ